MLADFATVVEQGTRDEALLASIDWERLPRHVAIIMDGNGRWAAGRGQPRIAGHRAGVEAVRASVDTGARLEVDALMRMLRRYLRLELDEIDRQHIRFQAIGRIEGLNQSVQREIMR